jgi:aryl-alcohol dehydrogenase-like predicted oxidoreductase
LRYRALGNSGLRVSAVGLGGTNFGRQLDQDATTTIVSAAIDSGVTFIDTAEAYGHCGGSEDMIGQALRGRRDTVILATKFGHPDYSGNETPGSRRNIRLRIEASLRRLQTDYIDLYYLHFPDPTTPVEETLSTLGDLIREGKVRYAGACNLAGWQVVEAEWTARSSHTARYIACQSGYNLIGREAEKEVLPACRACGIGFIAYSPLARGLLTGDYRRDRPIPEGRLLAQWDHPVSDATFDKLEALMAFAAERGLSLLQVSLGGILSRDGICSIIVGASSTDQLLANIAAAEWIPTEEDRAALDAIV